MQRIFLVLVGFLGTPLWVWAQEEGASGTTFVNSVALWIAVAVGVTASVMVLRNAQKIGGGTLGQVYTMFGIGMLLVVIGFFVVVIPPWAAPAVIMRTHDLLFVAGYAVMSVGARKILTAAGM